MDGTLICGRQASSPPQTKEQMFKILPDFYTGYNGGNFGNLGLASCSLALPEWPNLDP
jgi:hypothetical protein